MKMFKKAEKEKKRVKKESFSFLNKNKDTTMVELSKDQEIEYELPDFLRKDEIYDKIEDIEFESIEDLNLPTLENIDIPELTNIELDFEIKEPEDIENTHIFIEEDFSEEKEKLILEAQKEIERRDKVDQHKKEVHTNVNEEYIKVETIQEEILVEEIEGEILAEEPQEEILVEEVLIEEEIEEEIFKEVDEQDIIEIKEVEVEVEEFKIPKFEEVNFEVKSEEKTVDLIDLTDVDTRSIGGEL